MQPRIHRSSSATVSGRCATFAPASRHHGAALAKCMFSTVKFMSKSGSSDGSTSLNSAVSWCSAVSPNRTGCGAVTPARALSRTSSCQCGCPACSMKARLRRPTHSLRRICGLANSPVRPTWRVKPASTNRKFCSAPCFNQSSRYPVQIHTSSFSDAIGTTRWGLPRLRAIISLARPPNAMTALVLLIAGANARSPLDNPIASPKRTASVLQRCEKAAADRFGSASSRFAKFGSPVQRSHDTIYFDAGRFASCRSARKAHQSPNLVRVKRIFRPLPQVRKMNWRDEPAA